MPIKPKDSRMVGFSRVKARPQRLPKLKPIPVGQELASDEASGTRIYYNPPASSPNALITPTVFLPKELRHLAKTPVAISQGTLPPRLTPVKPQARLSPEQIEEVRTRRSEGAGINALAREFGVSTLFISLVAPLKKEARAAAAKQEEAIKATWSERKRMYREIRQTRRSDWGYTA
ncbi:mitochondrial ribosomal protein subunit L20-domain-containing protein [Protomyces lactucae-debilis]|uniref:Mitochondrial ribosomal protein subunit L20-domain-containing protein n=1 Tax=Protomyces lactucae-debilis TaxID=2754530 RepID=A0A1Y2FIT4_PROLT|nr:mitochondrial ribosomal protein subunit L20-domain-containing protein [Protomyces lactucae-debilis]ORY83882.1 mitochondrial ribosomal protein subunit L20-domain-containing protein [Protomyces lactucae-debilis]